MRFGNVFSKYPNDISCHDRTRVEQIGCNFLDSVAVRQELCLPVGRLAASFASKSVHGGFADPTFDGLIPVQHKKRECHSFAVMSDDFIACQGHRNYLSSIPKVSFCSAFVEGENQVSCRGSQAHSCLGGNQRVRKDLGSNEGQEKSRQARPTAISEGGNASDPSGKRPMPFITRVSRPIL